MKRNANSSNQSNREEEDSSFQPRRHTTERTDRFNRNRTSMMKAKYRRNREALSMIQMPHFFVQRSKIVPPDQILQGNTVVNPSKQTDNSDFCMDLGIPFQEDIIVEVLVRLPVRSLLRFKCVSKSWKAIISDPCFQRKHLNHAKNNQNSQKLLVCPHHISKDTVSFFYRYSLSSLELVEVHKLTCPSSSNPWFQNIYCSYDGLCLVGVKDYPEPFRLVLWNPSTRESILLPCPSMSIVRSRIWGLGYDSTSEDYKILKIDRQDFEHSEILALKSGSWRKVDRHPTGVQPVYSCMDSLAFVHGAFHWLGMSSLNYSVVSFDISNEVYGEITLPEKMVSISYEEYNRSGVSRSGVSVQKGMLCCYSTSYIPEKDEGTFKLWVMKDYGVKESWIISATIICNSLYLVVPKCIIADRYTLLLAKPKLGDFGLRTYHGAYGICYLRDSSHQGFAYTESLISPNFFV